MVDFRKLMAENRKTRQAKQAEDAYILKQRQDEEPKPVRMPSVIENFNRYGWGQLNQAQRDELIADFEKEVYEVFGCFPKANWMK